jgi:hypothetical protein
LGDLHLLVHGFSDNRIEDEAQNDYRQKTIFGAALLARI